MHTLMHVGDLLYSVEGSKMDKFNSLEKAKKLILGPPGSTVEIVVLR